VAADPRQQRLRIVIANERQDRMDLVGKLVVELGHTVCSEPADILAGGVGTSGEQPDVALVGIGTSWVLALGLIERLVSDDACPVVVMLEGHDPEFVDEAAKRGVFGYVVDGTPQELRCALDIALRRFAAYHDLRGAFDRRALAERATGVLMERYQVDERRAAAMLRDHTRAQGLQLVVVAQEIIDGRLLPA
jgi:response regulator NasT